MNAITIKGGRIVDPANEVDTVGDLLLRDGKIAALGGEIAPEGDVLSAAGLVVCPGFVDIHCHLRQPGYEEKETIATGTAAAARGGFTTVCCMPNTNPPLDNPQAIEQVYKTASAEGSVRVLPVGCVTKGREGTEIADLQALASAGAAAFSDDGSPITDDKIMRAALRYSRISGIPVIDHCEDPAMAAGGEMNAGWLAVQLGLRGVPAASEYVMVQRDIMLAMLTGGHVHIAHVSTEGSVELIRQAKQAGINITAEAAPHHLTLTEDAIGNCNANARVNPPLRTRSDVEALIRGLADGAIDCIATDHAPHTRGEKSRDFRQAPPGISGFETAFGSLMSLVHEGRFSLPRLIGWLTFRPAGIINHGELGTLKEGSAGDVTLIDPEREWTVNPHDFASRGKNTPLAGAVLKGKVMATVSAGRLVYRDSMTRITIRTG